MKDGDVVTSMSMGDVIRGAMMMIAYQYGLCLYLGLICFFLRGGFLVFCTNLVLVFGFWCLIVGCFDFMDEEVASHGESKRRTKEDLRGECVEILQLSRSKLPQYTQVTLEVLPLLYCYLK